MEYKGQQQNEFIAGNKNCHMLIRRCWNWDICFIVVLLPSEVYIVGSFFLHPTAHAKIIKNRTVDDSFVHFYRF